MSTDLKNEGDEKGEDQRVESERLDQPDTKEHQRPRLVELLRLAVDACDGLPDQVSHARARSDGPRAGRDTDPNKFKLLLD
jgi:antirestriction protein ArdC